MISESLLSGERFEQRLGLLEVGGVKTFGEPVESGIQPGLLQDAAVSTWCGLQERETALLAPAATRYKAQRADGDSMVLRLWLVGTGTMQLL